MGSPVKYGVGREKGGKYAGSARSRESRSQTDIGSHPISTSHMLNSFTSWSLSLSISDMEIIQLF